MDAITGGNGSLCITSSQVDHGSLDSYRYFLARRTVFEMLKDRGYDVHDREITCTFPEFRSVFGNNPNRESLRICVSHRASPTNKVLVIFCGTDEIRKKNILEILGQLMNKGSLNRLILILQSKMNNFARKELERQSFKYEIFQITDLLANITKHILQPKFHILSAEEKQVLLSKYNLEDKKLPHMQESDAMARYYGLEKGQVVKVTFSGGYVGAFETFRCVV
ncbi:hypothetical protein UlMin_027055 [Ulmus minor]